MDAIFETSTLGLPEAYIKKIGTDRFAVREVKEGLLLIPVRDEKSNLRGLLKNTGYGTAGYFEQKRHDKELEQ